MYSGSNGASNLINRLVTHDDVDTGDTNNVGETGLGASLTVGHVLTVSKMPFHNHQAHDLPWVVSQKVRWPTVWRYYHRQPGLHQYCRREY